MLGHADETDDTHPSSLTHPGTSVIPAAIAIGEKEALSGASVLRAIVLGYDICARMVVPFEPHALMRSGHHSCAFGQVFGAAAAAGSLLRLDALRMRYLISYASQQVAGLYTNFRDPDHVEKAYVMGGMPAHNGAQAALMVAHGWTGVEDVFSGARDFFHTFESAPGKADRAAVVRGLGSEYEIMRASIKRWPVGGPIQAPLQLLDDLIREHRFKAQDVAKLVVTLPEHELPTVDGRTWLTSACSICWRWYL